MKDSLDFLMSGASEVLTPEQEIELFTQLKEFQKQIQLTAKMPQTDVVLKRTKWWQTKQKPVRDRIISANMGLVSSMAKKTWNRTSDFDTLLSEGLLVLTRCCDKFDLNKGFRFSTYVCRALLNAYSRLGVTDARRMRMLGGDMEHGERVTESYEDVLDPSLLDLRRALDKNLAALSPCETTVIRRRFGLTGEPVTLHELGLEIGYTKERIRQIQNEAMDKLREVMGAGQISEEENRELRALLEDLDNLPEDVVEDMTHWEHNFIVSLVQNSVQYFVPKQAEKLKEIAEKYL